MEVAEPAGREVVVRVAGREHEPVHPLGVLGRDELTERAAGVVAHEGGPLDPEAVEELDDDAGQARRRQVGVRIHGHGVPAHRPVGDEAPEAIGQQRHDLAPDRPVQEDSVDEHDRRAVTDVVVPDDAAGGRHLALLPLVA